MPEPSTTAPNADASGDSRPPFAGDDYLRLVLFGLPEAGKSSLLGALGEAARSQADVLGGLLVDRSQRLTELSRALYAGSPPVTAQEVVSYPVELGDTQALLVDCDGRVANEMLLRKQPPDEDSPEGTLAHEVVEADTLILVVDSSAPKERIETDFAEFNRFLKIMEHDRGRRVEVSGLPVFLVLTKCDLLARRGDSSADWIDRIEQRKRDVDAHFREFLENEEAGDEAAKATKSTEEIDSSAMDHLEMDMVSPPPTDGTSVFGGIDLNVWATAVKRPELAGTPAKPREPYGVAELFRQCLTAARTFRRREERSSRRVVRTSIGSVIFALVLLTLVVALFVVNRNTRLAMLAARVEDFRALDHGPPARRLRGTPTELKEKQARLEDLHNDPLFTSLHTDLRSWVDQRIEELEAYIPWYEKVIEEPPPESERTEDGLEQRIVRLKKDLAVPRPEWTDTDAALIVQQRLKDAEALRKATQDLRNWYLDSSEAAAKLWTFAGITSPADIDWGDWTTQTEMLVAPNRKPPFDDTSLTYATAMRFDKVIEARASWETERSRLNRLLQVCSALGLATASPDRPAVLVFPRNVTLTLTRGSPGGDEAALSGLRHRLCPRYDTRRHPAARPAGGAGTVPHAVDASAGGGAPAIPFGGQGQGRDSRELGQCASMAAQPRGTRRVARAGQRVAPPGRIPRGGPSDGAGRLPGQEGVCHRAEGRGR